MYILQPLITNHPYTTTPSINVQFLKITGGTGHGIIVIIVLVALVLLPQEIIPLIDHQILLEFLIEFLQRRTIATIIRGKTLLWNAVLVEFLIIRGRFMEIQLKIFI